MNNPGRDGLRYHRGLGVKPFTEPAFSSGPSRDYPADTQ